MFCGRTLETKQVPKSGEKRRKGSHLRSGDSNPVPRVSARQCGDSRWRRGSVTIHRLGSICAYPLYRLGASRSCPEPTKEGNLTGWQIEFLDTTACLGRGGVF